MGHSQHHGSGSACTAPEQGRGDDKIRPQGDIIVAFQYLKGAYRKDKEGFIATGRGVTLSNWKKVDLV